MSFATEGKLERVGVMGGTFDPIHHGHLYAAEQAAEHFGLQRVIFIPCGQPPHKPGYEISSAEDRYLMVALATNGNPRFEVSRLELERPGPSYTIDTLRALHKQLGPECELFFITGADAVLEVGTWKQADDVLQESIFVAVHRPGYQLGALAATIGERRAELVRSLELAAFDISSTDLRRRVAQGLSLRYLTPEPVVEYIRHRGLYRPE